MGPLSPTAIAILPRLASMPASLGKMCANAANVPPREQSNRDVCKFTLCANVHGRTIFTARVIGSYEWQIPPALYPQHNLIDGKFPTERAQMPALTRLPNLYTGTIPPVNFPKMCLILDHLTPTGAHQIWWAPDTYSISGHSPGGAGGAGTWDFKWRGWSKDFFGFEIFDSRIFWGGKIWLG